MDSSSVSESVHQVSSEDDVDEDAGVLLALAEVKMIFSTTFEDGAMSQFSTRSADDPTTLAVSEEFASSGKKSLCASGRQNEKNGPVLKLEGLCEPNNKYFLNFSVMQKDRTPVTIGLEYSDTNGNVQTKSLFTTKEGGRWHNVKYLEFDLPDDYKSGYIYFEGGTSDLFVDNLNLVGFPAPKIENDIASLSEVFKDAFKLGTSITPYDLTSRNTMALLEKHFSSCITVGNELKPDYVLDENATAEYYKKTGDDEHPQISFEMAKPVLEYARVNKIPVRLHTLVWHSQTPTWFFKEGYDPEGEWVTPKKMNARMKNYIKTYFETITKLYPDIDFYACDVVNEAWLEDGRPRIAGDNKEIEGHSAWVNVYGDNSFIEKAFTYARKYAPAGCKLYYNDYNEYMLNKMNAIVEMATDLKEKGIIDGIGMQSHLDVRQGYNAFPSVDMYNKALDTYSELGLDIQVTELDATVPNNSNDQYFEAQAEYYKGIVNAIYD
ncbi:MAG: endo-1,4-beta-xylanase, partial [Ruminococcus sp.]|nr:endo-1,4-beta-xylanase [Ruminococcus sp.]